MRAWTLGAVCLLAAGCGRGAKLDPLLYGAYRVDHYALQASGETPEETVDPSQLEAVRVTTEDGVELGAAYVKATSQPPQGYVLFFHGAGEDLDDALPRLKRFANMGYDTLGFDYRGFGTSSNVPISEAGIDLDGRAVLQYLTQRIGGADRLFYAGHSLGAAAAAQRALEQPARALFIESGFASLDELQRESTQLDIPEPFVGRDRWATDQRLPDIHIPVLILHGGDDGLVRPTHARINYAAANEPKLLVLVQGAGHDTLPQVMGPHYAELIHGFVDPALAAP